MSAALAELVEAPETDALDLLRRARSLADLLGGEASEAQAAWLPGRIPDGPDDDGPKWLAGAWACLEREMGVALCLLRVYCRLCEHDRARAATLWGFLQRAWEVPGYRERMARDPISHERLARMMALHRHSYDRWKLTHPKQVLSLDPEYMRGKADAWQTLQKWRGR